MSELNIYSDYDGPKVTISDGYYRVDYKNRITGQTLGVDTNLAGREITPELIEGINNVMSTRINVSN